MWGVLLVLTISFNGISFSTQWDWTKRKLPYLRALIPLNLSYHIKILLQHQQQHVSIVYVYKSVTVRVYGLFFLLLWYCNKITETHSEHFCSHLNCCWFILFYSILFSSELNYYCIQALIKPYDIRISFIWHWYDCD